VHIFDTSAVSGGHDSATSICSHSSGQMTVAGVFTGEITDGTSTLQAAAADKVGAFVAHLNPDGSYHTVNPLVQLNGPGSATAQTSGDVQVTGVACLPADNEAWVIGFDGNGGKAYAWRITASNVYSVELMGGNGASNAHMPMGIAVRGPARPPSPPPSFLSRARVCEQCIPQVLSCVCPRCAPACRGGRSTRTVTATSRDMAMLASPRLGAQLHP
jgi:hypothetical protein